MWNIYEPTYVLPYIYIYFNEFYLDQGYQLHMLFTLITYCIFNWNL